jgi:hypothetical protein
MLRLKGVPTCLVASAGGTAAAGASPPSHSLWHNASSLVLKVIPSFFSFSLSCVLTVELESSMGAVEEKYRAIPYRSLDVGFDRAIIRPCGSDPQVLISSAAERLLRSCRTFDTLHNHIRRFASLDHSSDEPDLPTLISDLLAKKLLRSSENYLDPISFSAPQAISSVCIPSSGRIDFLEKTVRSQLRYLEVFRPNAKILVVCDSLDPSIQSQTEKLLKQVNGGGSLQYAGKSQKDLYVRALTRIGIEPEIARFAIEGDDLPTGRCTIGANRNSILLHTIGESILSSDDDVIWRFALSPNLESGVRFSRRNDPRETWFYPNRDAVVQDANWQQADFLGCHEQLLGRNLSSIAQDLGKQFLDVADACDHMMIGLSSGIGRVVATMSGVVGDSGAYSADWILRTPFQTKARLWQSSAVFQYAFGGRDVLALVNRPTISHGHFSVGYSIGICNDGLLPPFVPIGRGEDGLFGKFVESSSKFNFFGHIPVGVFHDALTTRRYEVNRGFRFCDLIRCLVNSLSPTKLDVRGYLLDLGQRLLDIAQLPAPEFNENLTNAVLKEKSKNLRALRAHLVDDRCPPYWRHEVERLVEASVSTALECEFCEPLEFVPMGSNDAKLAARGLLEKVAKLIYSWPDIFDAALELRRRDIRLAVQVSSLR